MLSQAIVSYASEVLEPQLFGLGIRIEKMEDELVLALLPYTWRNKTRHGYFRTTSVVALLELVLQVFWEQHLNNTQLRVRISQLELDCTNLPQHNLYCQLSMANQEREVIEYSLLGRGKVEIEQSLLLFGVNHTNCSNVDIKVILEFSKALPSLLD